MEVLGLFKDVEAAAEGINNLVNEGIPEDTISSISPVPLPEGVLVKKDYFSWFQWVTVGSAVIGAITGFLLAAGTAALYPLYTGEKPIISLFPVGIITFEFAMLFALIGTVVGMLLQMHLPRVKKRVYDPEITKDMLGIAVTCHSEQVRDIIRDILKRSGAEWSGSLRVEE